MQKTDQGFRKCVCVTMMSGVCVWMRLHMRTCEGENIWVTKLEKKIPLTEVNHFE